MNPRQPPELRTAVRRLTVQFTVMMTLIIVLVGSVVFAIVSQSAAEANTKALFDATHIDSPRDAPMGMWVAVWHDGEIETSRDPVEGLPDLAAMERAAATREPVLTTADSDGRTFDVLSIAGKGREVQVARDQYETREELERLLWALVVAGGVAVLCCAVGSAWMARRAIQPLADALELQRRFVADASHELRTPLTVLSTRAQLARRRLRAQGSAPENAETLEDLNLVVADAQRLTGILEDLLIAADTRSTPPHTVIDVASAARAAVVAATPTAGRRSVRIRSENIQPGATVVASGPAIERLVLALLDNAIDHAHSDVEVEVAVKGKMVTIRVRDDGQGFSELAKERAFERFATHRDERVEADGPRHYGIGLALVAEIAGRTGGSVRIEDAPAGTGASILVDLPHAS